MILKLALACAFSLVTGTMGHFIFDPVLKSWNNIRLRRLARPAIGVFLNIMPFVAWLHVFSDIEEDTNLLKPISAYHLSFAWNAAGVILGYIIDDYTRGTQKNGGKLWEL